MRLVKSGSIISSINWVCVDCVNLALALPVNAGKRDANPTAYRSKRVCDICLRVQRVASVADFKYPVFQID